MIFGVCFFVFVLISARAQAQVSLVGGNDPYEGRVQVCISGECGTVCNNGWDSTDADVVCLSLGFIPGNVEDGTKFGEGTGSILLDDISCDGTEGSLLDCPHGGSVHADCVHSQDAAVSCTPVTFENGIRLAGGNSSAEGRVEVYYRGNWGTVCDDVWDITDAHVVCHSLGYDSAIEAVPAAAFGQGTGPIILDDVDCAGSEESIFHCASSGLGVNNCEHSEDAGVRCSQSSSGSVRLVGGASHLVGRVEVLYNGEWGTVCDSGWDLADAEVVCRSLGHGSALEAVSGAGFGEGAGSIVMADVDCSGAEANIYQCGNVGEANDCSHGQDAGVRCAQLPSTTIRLANGSVPSEGRVEVFYNGTWGTVCHSSWGIREANVVCRSLGYAATGVSTVLATFGEGTGPIVLDNVRCVGNETDLFDCPSNGPLAHSYCDHGDDAGVQCDQRSTLRLVGGSSELEGRVEMLYNGKWGSVCTDNWDLSNANTICRTLGIGYAESITRDTTFGQSTLPDVYKFDCNGYKETVLRCGGVGINNCRYGRNAGVRCYEGTLAPIRIVGGPTTGEGRVELLYNGQWGTVCDRDWGIFSFNANMACRTAGLSYAVEAVSGGRYEEGTGPMVLDDVFCLGKETSLVQCESDGFGVGYCYSNAEAGVRCYRTIQGSTRLAGGPTSNEGRVEIVHQGQWATVCDDGWNMAAANVTCTALGLGPALEAVSYAGYGQGGWAIALDDLNCTGQEPSLHQCQHASPGVSNCGHGEDAGVRCSPSPLGSVRLVDGPSYYEGRLEVFHDGQWGTVCDDFFDDTDAGVVCSMLGLGKTGTAVSCSTYGGGSGEITLDNVRCNGNETNLFSCPSNEPRSHDCTHAEDVGVVCGEAESRNIRLVDGASGSEGRVEVFHDGEWGTVCGDSRWDMPDAHVVCRYLGFNYAVEAIRDAGYGQGMGRIILGSMRCGGGEDSIFNCWKKGPNEKIWCGHHMDAGVRCSRSTSTPMRLVGGDNDLEGRLEVYFNGHWNTVCHDDWDNVDAGVVCRAMGLGSNGYGFSYARFGEGSGGILLSNVRCTGEETDLLACPSTGPNNNNCLHFQDAGVRCYN